MRYIIGVDVGATKVSAGLVYGHKTSKSITLPTQAQEGKDRVIANIFKAIQVFDHPKVKGIGLGVAGEIDQQRGLVVSSPNMAGDFKNIPLKKIVSQRFKKEVFMENDANCFTVAESIYGAGKKYYIVVGLTLGTGVGSGLVINKKLFNGATGKATEFGHITIAENGFLCSCGRRGHLEAYASGVGMIHIYQELTGETKDTFYIEEMAKRKHMQALRTLTIMSDALGIGIANIINGLNPSIVIIGGGLARVKSLWRPMLAKVKREVVYESLKNTKIVPSQLKDATIVGAALICQN